MKLLLCLVIFLLFSISSIDGFSLKKRVGTTGYKWETVATNVKDPKSINYSASIKKTDTFQFRIDRDDYETIYNDLYVNVTMATKNQFMYFNTYYSTSEIATSKSSTTSTGYCPLWYSSCGSNEIYFTLQPNNTLVSPLKNPDSAKINILISIKDSINLCKQFVNNNQ